MLNYQRVCILYIYIYMCVCCMIYSYFSIVVYENGFSGY